MATQKIDIPKTCSLLRQAEDILILAHAGPDGDTIGAAYALLYTLRKLGKRAIVRCSDEFAPRYDYLADTLEQPAFDPKYVVVTDVADTTLLGKDMQDYKDKIDLCIDHHPSNKGYSNYLLLDSSAAATCELLFEVIEALGVDIDAKIADCLYTGLTTDTGCFRYSNTTARSHAIAAKLIALGADSSTINRLMFETVTRGRLAVQSAALASLEFYFDGRCALMHMDRDIIEANQCTEDDLTGLSALPREIQGVIAGVTLKQNKERTKYKISLRTFEGVNASEVCERLGGGGHMRAAGCIIPGTLDEAKDAILKSLALSFQ